MSTDPSPTELASLIDLHLHRGDISPEELKEQCLEAKRLRLGALSVHGSNVELARHCLEESGVKVAAVVGFPIGAMDPDVKRYETEAAIDAGAQEIEVVLNVARLKVNDTRFVLRELRDVVEAADERPVKVIIEDSLLSDEIRRIACELIPESGAKFVQTSTGFMSPATTVENVRRLRALLEPKYGLKTCGGLHDAQTAHAMIEAGATRLGTSNVTAIVRGSSNGSDD